MKLARNQSKKMSILNDYSDVVILGGSGFIGRNLINHLLSKTDVSISILQRESSSLQGLDNPRIRFVEGNLSSKSSLGRLLSENSIVIDLVYVNSDDENENLSLLTNLLSVCVEKKIKKFIYLSTAVVVGNTRETKTSEETIERPYTQYEKTKLQLEKTLKDCFSSTNIDYMILRPTAVFGDGSKNLIKLVDDLGNGSRLLNYLKACVYGHRKMNLVSVSKVISAIMFLAEKNVLTHFDTFIVSDDEDEKNDYKSIELLARRALGMSGYFFPVVHLPPIILRIILRMRGRSNINSNRTYSSKRLVDLGWNPKDSFEKDVVEALNVISGNIS